VEWGRLGAVVILQICPIFCSPDRGLGFCHLKGAKGGEGRCVLVRGGIGKCQLEGE
jgi:hypothetical protein